jgi:hypothetical protein
MIGRLATFVIDCPDPRGLAAFYSELTGQPVLSDEDDWVVVGQSRDVLPHLAFQLAPDLQAPDWPNPARPQQVHLDIAVDDIEASEVKVLAVGATRLPGQGDDFRVYADPAGHPFCLVWDN